MRVTPGWLQIEGGWICLCKRHPTKAGESIRYRVKCPSDTYCSDCNTHRGGRVPSPEKKEVSCTCGSDAAGLPGHARYCDKAS